MFQVKNKDWPQRFFEARTVSSLSSRRLAVLQGMKIPSPPRQNHIGILLCFLLSGAAGLIYQVAWGKALGLIFGHTA